MWSLAGRSVVSSYKLNRAALAGEMSGSLGSPGPGLELDTVTVEAVPQKKGIILRHVEYTVKYSTVQYSTVQYSSTVQCSTPSGRTTSAPR